ncbi:MAG: cell division protein ZipA C-terminal FtsZ-binding domain-containing protein [Methylotenera sp.]|nr:cell division protein ZipA C-terminal FtsZ-binding domain-containing protein [Methylotenera sp.]
MSDLQIALIAIGALIILAVLILNWWQERRFHRQVQNHFSELSHDVLLPETGALAITEQQANTTQDLDDRLVHFDDAQDADNFTINVQVQLDGEEELALAQLEQGGLEADLDDHSSAEPVVPTGSAGLPAMLKHNIDATALLYLAKESTMAALNEASLGLFDGLDKPFLLHALDKDNGWHLLNETNASVHQAVFRVACSMQLADRGGAVSRGTLSRFQLAVTDLALKINADIESQEIDAIQAQASELDAFCIAVDKTVGFQLSHGEQGAFSAGQLRMLAQAQGLEVNDAGYLQAINAVSAKSSFIIFNAEHQLAGLNNVSDTLIKNATFQLDIPRVDDCASAFKHMVKVAQLLAGELNGQLLDANNKILTDLQIEQIFQQLLSIQDAMIARGIEPGSDAALRLFS